MQASSSEHALVVRLRGGDERAFAELVGRYHGQLIRLARSFVSSPAMAEDVVQETWLAVLVGIGRFEERSTLRTWLTQICANRARSAGVREHRTVPTERIDTALEAAQSGSAGAWSSPPTRASGSDDAQLLAVTRSAIAALPAMQRRVVTMRDVDGLSSSQVCAVLGLTETNQRVLLHRGRTHVRRVIRPAAAAR